MKKQLFLTIILIFGGMILPSAAQDDSNASTLKSEEISKRMIELIKAIKTREDVSPENIERTMKIRVQFDEKNRQNYGLSGLVKEATKWAYNLSVYSYPGDENKTNAALNFSFNYLNDDERSGRDDYAPICTVDFDSYRKELKDAGFTSAPYYGEHGRLLWWNFLRGAVSVQITAYGENAKRVKHECVSMLTVNVGSGATKDDEVNYPAQIENPLLDYNVKAESALLLTINKDREIIYKNKIIADSDFMDRKTD
jgi:hypothetical protein